VQHNRVAATTCGSGLKKKVNPLRLRLLEARRPWHAFSVSWKPRLRRCHDPNLNQFSKQHLGITCAVIKCEWDIKMIKKYLSSTGSDVVAAATHGILMLDLESLPLALF
jgi:hypothetical protein